MPARRVPANSYLFAGIGALKSLWSPQRWWRSATETVVIGSAAAVAYTIGAWLRGIVA